MSYKIRNMTRDELDIPIDWADKEGWNPGLYDRDCFYNTDPGGFFMGFLNNEPISCISAVKYNANFGFLGLYIVKKEFRSKGYGIKIWKEALKHLKGRNIGLDGVVAQQENYKKSGFKFAYNNARYEFRSRKFIINNYSIVPASSVSFEQLHTFDRQFVPADRKVFLSYWIKQPESTALASIKNKKIQGYGMIRKCRRGYKIGPLFAQRFEIADRLFQSLVNNIAKNSPIYLDIPEINPSAITLIKKYDMQKVFSTARMYTQDPPQLPIEQIYGVTTFELG